MSTHYCGSVIPGGEISVVWRLEKGKGEHQREEKKSKGNFSGEIPGKQRGISFILL